MNKAEKNKIKAKQLCGFSWKQTSVRFCTELWSTNYPIEQILHRRKEGYIYIYIYVCMYTYIYTYIHIYIILLQSMIVFWFPLGAQA